MLQIALSAASAPAQSSPLSTATRFTSWMATPVFSRKLPDNAPASSGSRAETRSRCRRWTPPEVDAIGTPRSRADASSTLVPEGPSTIARQFAGDYPSDVNQNRAGGTAETPLRDLSFVG